MKKRLSVGLVFCVIVVFTTPAMALDVDFSGFYRVRGFCVHDYQTFGYTGDGFNEHASDYLDMLLEVGIVFKVHPRLRLITGFTALDKVWGENDIDSPGLAPANSEDTNNIDWNQAYMEFETGIGQFQIGRMEHFIFNHDFMSGADTADGIKYTLAPKDMGGPGWNPLLLTLSYVKILEDDWGNASSDEDNDEYRATLGYFSESFAIDNLLVFQRNENANYYIDTYDPTNPYEISKADIWTYSLYLMAKFGIATIEGKWQYSHGYLTDLQGAGTPDDIELDAMGWLLQTTLDLGRYEAYIGWAHTDGDKSPGTDQNPGDTMNSLPGQFGDFAPLYFLTSGEGFHAASFGGMGNWSGEGDNPFGLDLLYLGGGIDITKDINISGAWGIGWADAVPTGSKKVGWETNLRLTWQIMDGLEYSAMAAFFNAGKFWEDAQNYPYLSSSADDGNCWALSHQLTLSF